MIYAVRVREADVGRRRDVEKALRASPLPRPHPHGGHLVEDCPICEGGARPPANKALLRLCALCTLLYVGAFLVAIWAVQ